MIAYFGYQNNGVDALNLLIGERNKFTPGQEDLGQPTEFFKGRVANVVKATIAAGSTLRWILGDAFVDADITTERCQPAPVNCVERDIKEILLRLDSSSAKMKKIVARLAGIVISSNASPALKRRAQAYIDDAEYLYNAQWRAIWGKFPQVLRICPSCRQIDQEPIIRVLNARERLLYRLVKQTADLVNDADPSASPDARVSLATKINASFFEASRQLPRFLSDCD